MVSLTASYIRKQPPRAARYDIPDDDLEGLRLTVLPSGARSWSVRYVSGGRDRRLTLGKYPRIGIADARKLAAKVLLRVAAGEDPQAERVVERRKRQFGLDRPNLFGATYESYLDKKKNGKAEDRLKPSTLRDIEGTFARVLLPKFRKRPLSDITPGEIKSVVDKSGDPRRVFMICRAFLNWAVSELLLPVSPMAGLKPPTGVDARERVLTDDEIKAIWKAAEGMGYPFGSIVQLLLLTAARREEVAGMRRSELDGDVWTIPGDRVKNGREHAIYLAPDAVAILKAAPTIRNKPGFIFTTNGKTSVSGFSKAKAQLDEGSGVSGWVIHDLRRTAATGMASIGIAIHVIERCINHISGSFAGIVSTYQKHEYATEKREAWARWATRLQDIVADRPDNT